MRDSSVVRFACARILHAVPEDVRDSARQAGLIDLLSDLDTWNHVRARDLQALIDAAEQRAATLGLRLDYETLLARHIVERMASGALAVHANDGLSTLLVRGEDGALRQRLVTWDLQEPSGPLS